MIATKQTPVIVQGITGHQGSFHTNVMKKYGTNIVAGVTPGKGGQTVHGVPVYNTIADALAEHHAEYSAVFVPAAHAKDAAAEALAGKLNLVMLTEHLPVHDTLSILNYANKQRCRVFGPNCPGFIIPGEMKLGIIPERVVRPGSLGIVSRSGTLTYEIAYALTLQRIGQRSIVGIGGDPVIGTGFVDVLKMYEEDSQIDKIILIGEIGGALEIQAADYISKHISKPVIAFIAGQTAPPGKRMGHAGAIIMGEKETAAYKIEYLKSKGIPVAAIPSEIVHLLG